VLVYDFMSAGIPFDRGAQWMHTEARAALAAAATAAFGCAEEHEGLAVGLVRDRSDALVLDVWLRGDVTTPTFNFLRGEVQLAPLRDGRSHLSLSASYEPLCASEHSALDRRSVQRETEVRVREFLARVAMQLERSDSDPM